MDSERNPWDGPAKSESPNVKKDDFNAEAEGKVAAADLVVGETYFLRIAVAVDPDEREHFAVELVVSLEDVATHPKYPGTTFVKYSTLGANGFANQHLAIGEDGAVAPPRRGPAEVQCGGYFLPAVFDAAEADSLLPPEA